MYASVRGQYVNLCLYLSLPNHFCQCRTFIYRHAGVFGQLTPSPRLSRDPPQQIQIQTSSIKYGWYHIPFKIKAPQPFLNTIRTHITHQPEGGTGVASASTVDIPTWSNEKKRQENFTMFVCLGLLSSLGPGRLGASELSYTFLQSNV